MRTNHVNALDKMQQKSRCWLCVVKNETTSECSKLAQKRYKYLDLVRELKKLWNMKVTIVPIVIGALGTITKGLEDLKVGGRIETIQTTALLRTARILRRDLET